MVDYPEEAQVKHERMQKVLAALRGKQAITAPLTPTREPDSPPAEAPMSKSTDEVSDTPLVARGEIRLAVPDDAWAMEFLDRRYPVTRQEVLRLAPRSTIRVFIRPHDQTKIVAPKAWSFRVRDSNDPHLRRTARVMEICCNHVLQLRLDPRCGIETDELEADYYRMALESGKEATLVARKISDFSCFSYTFPLEVELLNPSERHNIDILIRVWGEQTP